MVNPITSSFNSEFKVERKKWLRETVRGWKDRWTREGFRELNLMCTDEEWGGTVGEQHCWQRRSHLVNTLSFRWALLNFHLIYWHPVLVIFFGLSRVLRNYQNVLFWQQGLCWNIMVLIWCCSSASITMCVAAPELCTAKIIFLMTFFFFHNDTVLKQLLRKHASLMVLLREWQ